MEGYNFETQDEALEELNKLTREFLNMPTPYEYEFVLSQIEKNKADIDMDILYPKIMELTNYIREKWRK